MRVCIGALLVLCGLTAACRTIETKRPIYRSEPVRTAPPTRMFEVQDERGPQGFVVLFEATASPQEALYVVRNLHQQDLGVIDALGRAFRYQPHEEKPTWVGSGSILRGVHRILKTRSQPIMQEVSLPESPARSLFTAEKSAPTQSQRN